MKCLFGLLFLGLVAAQTPPECCPAKWGDVGALFPLPRDCLDVRNFGGQRSGVYVIYPQSVENCRPVRVWCDQSQSNGGWTVIQRRVDGSVDFLRDWDAYKTGFGSVAGEHWLGLENMHHLTIQGRYELRVRIEDFAGQSREAEYRLFRVGNEKAGNYTLTVTGFQGGGAGNGLSIHNGMPFSTIDRDNDSWGRNCAEEYTGAWWYKACFTSNLNGQYLRGTTTLYGKGIVWSTWRGYNYSFRRVEMKIRRNS
ncbi:microfibril-associated glycoprotein 4-like [Anneissia japonica]|uniref:microfibril-associated glycoprotein 4-like n=1 Tax=Anneissia japonica TaxID=1529436 RepID=UPI001425AD89|nr:microfibril-associated glycoprotein 4-like [Anneissia japonica]